MKRPKKHPKHPSTALVKYESKDLVQINRPQIDPPPKFSRSRRVLAKVNTPMSTKTFVTSHIALLMVSLFFLAGLYFILNHDQYQNSLVSQYVPITSKPASFNLEINNPEDELLTYTKSLVVSGTTIPKSSVVITAIGNSNNFAAVEADNNGRFQKTINLSPGLNTVEISSFDNVGGTKTVSKTVYYSEEILQ